MPTTDTELDSGFISGRVTWDVDRDGTEANSSGGYDQGLGGLTVRLYDVNGNLLLETTTEADGSYRFEAPAGEYIIKFPQIADYVYAENGLATNADADSDATADGTTAVITLQAGQTYANIDASLQKVEASAELSYTNSSSKGCIRGALTFDIDGNGNESGNFGLRGHVVQLLDVSGNVVAETTTGSYGTYRFDVAPGEYIVRFPTLDGYEYVEGDRASDGALIDSDVNAGGLTNVIKLEAGQVYGNTDAIVTSATERGSISGRFFFDTDGDGVDNGEPGVAGAVVEIRVYKDGAWQLVQQTLTDQNGNYVFNDLDDNNDYRVRFINPTEAKLTKSNVGSDDRIDSDINQLIGSHDAQINYVRVKGGEHRIDMDAGLDVSDKGSIEGRFFLDQNNNNIDDDEPGLAGITVQLWYHNGSRWAVLQETTTKEGGIYKFANLDADDYYVRFNKISGLSMVAANQGDDDSRDSDVNVWVAPDLWQGKVVLGEGQHVTDFDAGMRGAGLDYSFIDADDYPDLAVRSLGEELIVNGDFENHANAGTTGNWQYATLQGWQVVGDTPTIELQTANYGTGNVVGNAIVELDNRAGVQEGIQQTFTATEAGTYQVSFDYGLRDYDPANEPWWYDSASNGIAVYVDGELVQIVGSGTDSNFDHGFLHRTFDLKLTAGAHTIRFVEDGYDRARTDDGMGAELDNVSVRKVDMVVKTGILSGTFFYDGDQDGQQDGGERGLGGHTVYLLKGDYSYVKDADGQYVTTTTEADGSYAFEGLSGGNYRAGFVVNDAPAVNEYGLLGFVRYSGFSVNSGDFNWSNTSNFTIEGSPKVIRFIDDDGKLDTDGLSNDHITGTGLVEIDGNHYSYALDYYANFAGSDGKTYNFAVIDVDLDGDGSMEVNSKDALGLQHLEDGRILIPTGDIPPAGVTLTAMNQVTFNPADAAAPRFVDMANYVPSTTGEGALELDVLANQKTGPNGETMQISKSVVVTGGVETGGVDGSAIGQTVETTIKVCENETFVKDFDTVCQIMSEDVYFMVGEPICAHLGRTGFDENLTQSWNNSTTTAVPYYVFLETPADTDLTFTISITTDPDKVASGASGYAPDGFAYLTDQANEINAPRYEQIEITVKAGQTKSEAFYIGTEAARMNYAFGIEIDSIYNHDQNEMCEQVQRVVTTPVAFDLNRDGKIGVTGDSTSSDKSGLTIGETVHFDMNADGVAERIEWFDGSGDGILIDNRDGNAFVDMDGSRLFGDDNGKYANGYANLRVNFDANGDGKISGAELNGLMLWVDDGDAVVEAGELQTLKSHSITEISGLVSTSTDASGREIIRSTVRQDFEATGNVTYRLEGPDAALFDVNDQGQVTFKSAPDYENPLDQGRDNVYNVTLVRETDDPTCAPARENLRIEICDKPSLGDTVWYDKNKNGVYDSGDTPAAGVTVKLIDAATGAVLAAQITDAKGNYLFDDLDPGNYRVMFVAPGGYEFTTPAPVGPEVANNDSDAGVNGMTGVINLVDGEHQRNVDAGLVDPGTASLGDTVWYDKNKNGVYDSGDTPAAGVTVKLIDPVTGAVLATQVTDAKGNYLFDNLDAGDYQVMFVSPDGYEFTTQSTAAADAVNNDSDAGVNGMTGTVTLSIGEAERDVDAGLVDPGTASLGDTVWYDKNKNGVYDSGDTPAAGVTVKLIDPVTGAVLATQVTDAKGNYLFDNLDAGDYQVMFVSPDGYEFTTQSTAAADAVNNDSDAGVNGMTGTVTLSIGEAERDVDAGLVATNTPPSAVNDAAHTCADEAVTVDVLANDSDPDGDSLTITAVGGQAISEGQTVQVAGINVTLSGGQLVIDGEDAFAFLDIGEEASQSIGYTVSDGNGGTASATLDMTFCGDANSVDSFIGSLPESGSYQVVSAADQQPLGSGAFDLKLVDVGDERFDGVVFEQAYCLSFDENVLSGASFAGAPVLTGEIFGAQSAAASAGFNANQISSFNGESASDNLDLVNWIIAQDFENNPSGSTNGDFNGWEVQFAIWELTDDFDSDLAFGATPAFGDSADTQYILEQAKLHGEGFVAGTGDIVGVIVDPEPETTQNSQPFIIGVNMEFYDCLC